MNKPKVAHISTTYLKLSESYIYSFIKNHKSYDPFVVTEELINAPAFPTKKVYEIQKPPLKARIVNQIYRERFFRKKSLESFYLKHLEKEYPSIIMCHYGPTGVYSLPFRKVLGIPVVTYFYGLDLSFSRLEKVMGKTGGRFSIPLFSRGNYWRDALMYLFRHGDFFVVPSNQAAMRLIDLGAPKEKVRVVNFGVDLESVKPAEKDTSSEDFKVAMVLSLEENRGFESSLDAFKVLAGEIPSFQVDIYGDGSKRREFMERVAVLGISKSVQIISDYPYNRFLDNIGKYKVFLNPVAVANVDAMEGWVNYSMMQAMSVGVVPVATHVVGAELIDPGETGYFIRQNDADDIVEKLELLYKDKKKMVSMSENAKERIELYFNATKQTAKLEKIFDDAITAFRV